MIASHPENPDHDIDDASSRPTEPQAVIDEVDLEVDFEPGTELLPEKGDFHRHGKRP